VVLAGGAFAFGYAQHKKGHGEAAGGHGEAATAKVEVIKAKPLTSDQALTLPGVAKALEETKIYPRSAGYVKKWLVDIGDKVEAGQLMAEIEVPDVTAQLLQARAQLQQARAAVQQAIAQRTYSKQNAARNVGLADQKLVSQATVEQAQAQAGTDEANVAAAQANVAAQEANVRRLAELESFAKITAPFAGRVTTRSIERGALVGAGTSPDQQPLYTLVAIDPIRVFVDVPQTVAPSVKLGNEATVTVREFPGQAFPGKITHATGALDPELHTMSTEIQIPNPEGKLLPGMYVQAALTLPVPHRVLEIPATALYNDASGLRVATVDAHDHVKYQPITIERDNGASLWIATGLTGDERIVKIAVPSLLDGDPVDVPKTEVTKADGSAGSAK